MPFYFNVYFFPVLLAIGIALSSLLLLGAVDLFNKTKISQTHNRVKPPGVGRACAVVIISSMLNIPMSLGVGYIFAPPERGAAPIFELLKGYSLPIYPIVLIPTLAVMLRIRVGQAIGVAVCYIFILVAVGAIIGMAFHLYMINVAPPRSW